MRHDSDCLFCRIVAGEIPATIVFSDDHTVAFRDIQPAAPTHVLVIPREHIRSLHELEPADHDVLRALAMSTQRVAELEGIAGAGYRVVTNVGADGGQSVDHLHFHVLGGRQLRGLG
ncbi:MAG TPA: histidine triad nucleotide-binding protein [Thermomicrobiales bacterium]|nr:histidine triad nucleotide-binding protein [Thermomicrobiales bacterium]